MSATHWMRFRFDFLHYFGFNSTDRYRNMAKVAVAPAVHSFSDLRPSSRALTITPRPASRKSAGFGTLDRPSSGNISRGRNVAVSSRGSKGVASSMLIIRPGRRDSSGSSLGKWYKQHDDPLSVFNLLLFYFNYDLISRRSFHFNFLFVSSIENFQKNQSFPIYIFPHKFLVNIEIFCRSQSECALYLLEQWFPRARNTKHQLITTFFVRHTDASELLVLEQITSFVQLNSMELNRSLFDARLPLGC